MHCNAVRTKLKDKLKLLTKSKATPELKVLFISNTQYQKHVGGYEIADFPALDIEATGIPGLRQMLYSIPTPRVRDIEDYRQASFAPLHQGH